MNEEWKWIKGYEGLYQISNLGRLKSFHRDKSEGRIMSLANINGWYFTVILRDGNGEYSTKRIHQLVAEHFIGEIPKGYHVHHKDGNKQNNKVSNLEVISRKEHTKETMKQHPDYCKGMNEYNKYVRPRHIRQYDLEGHFIAEYANSKIASELTGICARNILQVANKNPFNSKGSVRKQAGGYIWKFADDKGGD